MFKQVVHIVTIVFRKVNPVDCLKGNDIGRTYIHRTLTREKRK
jgi:hypothetical protein